MVAVTGLQTPSPPGAMCAECNAKVPCMTQAHGALQDYDDLALVNSTYGTSRNV